MLARDRYAANQAYDEYDEYEEDGDDQEEEEEEEEEQEEDEKPSQEVLDFLKLRERFKEKIRQKLKKENSAVVATTSSLAKSGTAADTKFGSFFGPSQRVIAPRVIEESRSMREAQHIVSKAPSSTSNGKRVSSNAEVKPHSDNGRPHKVVNESLQLKRKVQTLKERRDYSFLLSDDADLPSRTNDPAPRSASVSSSDAQPGRSLPPPKMSMAKPGKQIPDSHLSRNAISRDQHVKKGEYQKIIPPNRPKASSSEPRKVQAEYQKTIPPSRPQASSSEPRKLQGEYQKMSQKTIPPSRPKAIPSEPKKMIESRGRIGHSQPLVARASSVAAAQGTITKKVPVMGGNKPSNMERTPLATKTQSAVLNNHSQQRRETQDTSKGKLLPKQTMTSSRPQLSKPSKQIQQHRTHEDRPKQKPARSHLRNPFDDEDDDIDDPMSFLRNKLLSRFNSSKYQVDDDDDSDMEANFDDIMKEELRSSRIAQEEDDEQLRLIEEEERRERMRKEAKRRKLTHR